MPGQEVGQGKMKYLKISCCMVHNQPHFTQASSPPPPHYYLARHRCSGARPRNAMNLVCLKSKIREKTGLGAWGRRQAQPGDWG